MLRRISVVALVLTVAIVPPAQATDSETLPLPAFGAMVVDQAHKRVFVSGGAASNAIVVLDFSGRVKKSLSNQHGATGLVLSEDGRVLYAALTSGDAISVIDTATLTETNRYSTGAQTCPTHLARTGALVWFGYGCDARWNGRIGRLDPAAAEPVVLDKGNVAFQTAPYLTSAGTSLVAVQAALSLADAHVFTVAAGELVTGAAGEVFGSNVLDVALSPDGTTLHSAAGSRDRVEAFATADLAGRGSYSTGPHPNAVRVSPDGRHVAVGAYTSRSKAVWVFAKDAGAPAKAYGLDSAVLADRGLAWSGDGRYLFVVVRRAADTRPGLIVISRPAED